MNSHLNSVSHIALSHWCHWSQNKTDPIHRMMAAFYAGVIRKHGLEWQIAGHHIPEAMRRDDDQWRGLRVL